MFRPWVVRYAIAAIALVAAACGQADTPGPGAAAAPDTLRGTFTTSENTAQGTTISLQFTEDGRLVANAGCNTISGPITFSGNQIDTADLAITEIACDPALHEQDQRLSAFLGSKPTWTFAGESLVLSGAGTTLTLMQAKASLLVGPVWTADTLIQGEMATPAPVAATVVFGSGEVTATGLCNLKGMPYRTSGSTITFTLEAITLKMCSPDIMAVEHALVGLTHGDATYKIDGRNLTITKDGKGIRFTATG
jgi:heat shock protein HslJ